MNPSAALTIEQERILHGLCWEFEEAWCAGQSPCIEDWLQKADGVDRDIVLSELLAVEFELHSQDATNKASRSSASNTKSFAQDETLYEFNSLASYLTRFPSDEAIVRQAYAEFTADNAPASPDSFQQSDGRYLFVDEIARGGTGVVWRVFDTHLQRESAIKVLLDCQDNSEMRRRLEQEARLCGRLQHPGIVPVHELEHFDDGRPFISMKLIQGQTLDEILKSDHCPDQPALLRILLHACEAVAHAHEVGIIHRDLKPANIMVGAFREVQVMDWGLGKDLATVEGDEVPSGTPSVMESTNTQVGTVFGTLAYMSPEQASGAVDKVDKRSDVFSLGAILCEVLTGERLYETDAADLHDQAKLANLGSIIKRIESAKADPAIIGLTKQCLAIDPTDRPADAGEVARVLKSHLSQKRMIPSSRLMSIGAGAVLLLSVLVVWQPWNKAETTLSAPTSSNMSPIPQQSLPEVAAPIALGAETGKLDDDQIIGDIRKLVKIEQWDAAEALLRQELKTRSSIPLKQELADVFWRRGRHETAESLFRECIAEAPDRVDCYRRLAAAFTSAGRTDDVEELLRDAAHLFPDEMALQADLLRRLIENGRDSEAMHVYCERRDAIAGFFRIRVKIGRLFLKYHRWADLEQLCQELESINSADPMPLIFRAYSCYWQGRFEAALTHASKAADQPELPGPEGRYREARDLVKGCHRSIEMQKRLDEFRDGDDNERSLSELSTLAAVCNATGDVPLAVRFYRIYFQELHEATPHQVPEQRVKTLGEFVWSHLSRSDLSDFDRQHVCEFAVEQIGMLAAEPNDQRKHEIVGMLRRDEQIRMLAKFIPAPEIPAEFRAIFFD